eukprot:5052345-Heterocapsa_arctica.AAC.1
MKPWDQGWSPCIAGSSMDPMMRSREVTARGNIVVSTRQYAPAYLVQSGDFLACLLYTSDAADE